MDKICKKCNTKKPLEKFLKRKEGVDGYRHECCSCYRERQLLFSRTRLGMSGNIYRDQKKDSKRRGHPSPSYTLEELREWLFAQVNFEVLYIRWTMSNYNKYERPSIDRLDESQGYYFGNIQLMTWGENNQKGYDSRKKNK